jgi:hypothetical protein
MSTALPQRWGLASGLDRGGEDGTIRHPGPGPDWLASPARQQAAQADPERDIRDSAQFAIDIVHSQNARYQPW